MQPIRGRSDIMVGYREYQFLFSYRISRSHGWKGKNIGLTKELGFHQLVLTFIHEKESLLSKAILPFPCKMKNIENACAHYGGML
jgi:hypothetical protein